MKSRILSRIHGQNYQSFDHCGSIMEPNSKNFSQNQTLVTITRTNHQVQVKKFEFGLFEIRNSEILCPKLQFRAWFSGVNQLHHQSVARAPNIQSSPRSDLPGIKIYKYNILGWYLYLKYLLIYCVICYLQNVRKQGASLNIVSNIHD